MTDWTKLFNELPYEVRNIAHYVELQHKVQALQEERYQLIQNHAKKLQELDAEIKRLKRLIANGDA
jgi:DNA-binding transcriptional regulator/RsmH inhibitor MraZ